MMDFPGGAVKFTPEMRFISESPKERTHCYRVLDDDGQPILDTTYAKVFITLTYHAIFFQFFACS